MSSRKTHVRAIFVLFEPIIAIAREPSRHDARCSRLRIPSNLARLLPGLDIVALDAALGHRAGALLARSRTTDVIDAALALRACRDRSERRLRSGRQAGTALHMRARRAVAGG